MACRWRKYISPFTNFNCTWYIFERYICVFTKGYGNSNMGQEIINICFLSLKLDMWYNQSSATVCRWAFWPINLFYFSGCLWPSEKPVDWASGNQSGQVWDRSNSMLRRGKFSRGLINWFSTSFSLVWPPIKTFKHKHSVKRIGTIKEASMLCCLPMVWIQLLCIIKIVLLTCRYQAVLSLLSFFLTPLHILQNNWNNCCWSIQFCGMP